MRAIRLILTVTLISLGTITSGKVFYLDPIKGKITNNGSINSPWSTLQAVIENNLIETYQWNEHPQTANSKLIIKNSGAAVKAGDTLMLLSGYHGAIELVEFFNKDYITIMAMPGQKPTIAHITITGGCYWNFSGLTISAEFAPSYANNALIFLETHDWRGPIYKITVENCTAYSVADATGWTMQQWDELSCDGININGDSILIQNNYFKNVDFGISMSGNLSVIHGNTVENFAGDGLRGLGNDLLFEYNTVKNCYAVNANHDDGFQSWSINDDPPRERVTLRGNTIINYEDPNQPFRGTLQGIGCFDGPYKDWVIENNVIITDHWHGISLYGAYNCRIVNNTVIDINNETPGPPWIGIFDHKDGTPSQNCIVRNNIATSYSIGAGCTDDHNLEIDFSEYNNYFEDFAHFNLNLIKGCAAIDSGINQLAPAIDNRKYVRPFGKGIDIGAFEYGSYPTSGKSEMDVKDNSFVCYPNPFTTQGTIRYELNQSSMVSLILYDITGRYVSILESKYKQAGQYEVVLDASNKNLTPGLYLCRMYDGLRVSTLVIDYKK